jgi:Tfp pilus assembly protein PilO
LLQTLHVFSLASAPVLVTIVVVVMMVVVVVKIPFILNQTLEELDVAAAVAAGRSTNRM